MPMSAALIIDENTNDAASKHFEYTRRLHHIPHEAIDMLKSMLCDLLIIMGVVHVPPLLFCLLCVCRLEGLLTSNNL